MLDCDLNLDLKINIHLEKNIDFIQPWSCLKLDLDLVDELNPDIVADIDINFVLFSI